tara:strand:- start:12293 stop:13330 length:1038 start_codon:yes stop_codon:yes gene_type:complete
MIIGNRKIGLNQKPFIVAELSGNHNNNLEQAYKLIEAASWAGVDAIKIQTFTADSITMNIKNNNFKILDKESLWKNQYLYNLYKKASTPYEWHEKIFKKAKSYNLICFSSPFDESAVDFLYDLKAPAFKIASFENNHIPLIKKVISTNKPTILSTGLINLKELNQVVKMFPKMDNLALLKCTSTYPASPKNINLKTIIDMKKKYNCEVGLSDHTIGTGVALASIAYGATIIEKHLTLNRKDKAVDSAFSLEPKEFKVLKDQSIDVWESLGKIKYGPTNLEKKSLKYRRSIFISKNVKKNEEANSSNLRVIRPATGMDPKYYFKILGKKFSKNLAKGTPLKKIHLK